MKTLLIIGIGAGHPEHLTVQAIGALNQAQVFFLMDKGQDKQALNQLRRDILERYVSHGDYRIEQAPNPERGPDAGDYRRAVDVLNADKQQVFENLIAGMAEDECGAFLVWGDPSLYDSTLRILEAIVASGRQRFDYRVIPGITSVQALTAQHRIALNSIGQPVLITTGRQLAKGFPDNADSVVVMLDAQDTYLTLVGQGLHIYWGAYVGSSDEILISGPLDDMGEQIARVRKAARERHGWVMDTYVLRRSPAR